MDWGSVPMQDNSNLARAARLIAPDPAFLEAIYRTAVTPESYDRLMALWQAQLESALADLDPETLIDADDTDLFDLTPALTHFNTSLQILEHLGRTDGPRALQKAMAHGGLYVAIDASGRIVWLNARTARQFDLRAGMTIDRLRIDPTGLKRLQQGIEDMAALARIEPAEPPRAQLLTLHDTDGQPHHMLALPTMLADRSTHMVLRSANARWSPLLGEILRDSFELSDSELEIVALMIDGLDLPGIADERGRKLSTVRTQLKAILRKTRVRSQPQLVRLILGLAAHLPADGAAETMPRNVHFLTLRSGRRMPFHRIGPVRGRPVLFLHGMLDGVAVTETLTQELVRRDIQLIAPERPFFGSATGIDSDALPPGMALPRDAVPLFADDLDQLCRFLNLEQLVVIGHMAGAVYAFGFAARHPDRVRAIVNVAGGVPIVSPRQFSAMSARQRLVAYTARYTPTALPFILRAGIRQIDTGGEHRFIQALYADSPFDQPLTRQLEIMDLMRDGVRYAVAQGYNAFEMDSYHVVRDWTALANASRCPVHLVHGRHDPVVSCASVGDFAARLGQRAQLHVVDDIGQLVYFARPDRVLAVVEQALAPAG